MAKHYKSTWTITPCQLSNAILTLFLIVTLYSKVGFEMSYCGSKPET